MGEAYERRLHLIFEELRRIYGEHEPHMVKPARRGGTCPECGQGSVPSRGAEWCGGPNPDDRCDPLGEALFGRLDQSFLADLADVKRILEDTPEAWEWPLGSDASETLCGAVAETFRNNAEGRLFPRHALIPVDPATTRSELA